MDVVSKSTKEAIEHNFQLLRQQNLIPSNITDPQVTCQCSISTSAESKFPNNLPIAVSSVPNPFRPWVIPDPNAPAPIKPPAPASQFLVNGVGAIFTDDMPISLHDPGNAPFILPEGVTVESILAERIKDAEAMYEEAVIQEKLASEVAIAKKQKQDALDKLEEEQRAQRASWRRPADTNNITNTSIESTQTPKMAFELYTPSQITTKRGRGRWLHQLFTISFILLAIFAYKKYKSFKR